MVNSVATRILDPSPSLAGLLEFVLRPDLPGQCVKRREQRLAEGAASSALRNFQTENTESTDQQGFTSQTLENIIQMTISWQSSFHDFLACVHLCQWSGYFACRYRCHFGSSLCSEVREGPS